ncbi:MAG: hypothetical protein ACLSHJ_07090, partial [Oscillospiraceae bacterium]
MDHFECRHCKARGRFRKGRIVHHVKHLRDRPDLALSVFDPDTGARQLETLCKACHELEHPESQRQYTLKAPPLTAELMGLMPPIQKNGLCLFQLKVLALSRVCVTFNL